MPVIMAESFFHAEAHQAVASSSLERAFWLDQAAHAVLYESIHGAPPNLTPQQVNQRAAILNIARDILCAARNRELDASVREWKSAKDWEGK